MIAASRASPTSTRASRHATAPLAAKNGKVKLRVLVDWSSTQVFAEDGEAVLTDPIYPAPTSDGLAYRLKVGLRDCTYWRGGFVIFPMTQ